MQSDFFEILIPHLPPGVNKTYQIVKHGGKSGLALTPRARRWDKDAALIIGAAAGSADFEPDWEADYQIVIRWWGGRHDADAHLKIVQDCVTRKLGFDDRQITACVIERRQPPWRNEAQGVQVYLFRALERDWVEELINEVD